MNNIVNCTKDIFLEAMRKTINGVCVIACLDANQGKHGLTISSFASIAVDPEIIMVAINQKSKICRIIHEYQEISVNILAQNQQEIAQIFSGRHENPEKNYQFNENNWANQPLPYLRECLASLFAKIIKIDYIGTHHVIFAQVYEINQGIESLPLVYGDRQYLAIAPYKKANI